MHDVATRRGLAEPRRRKIGQTDMSSRDIAMAAHRIWNDEFGEEYNMEDGRECQMFAKLLWEEICVDDYDVSARERSTWRRFPQQSVASARERMEALWDGYQEDEVQDYESDSD